MADCGLPVDEELIQYGDSLENSACSCLNKLLEQQCDAVIVCQGMMASETIIYLHQKGIQLARDIDLVSFVDYDSEVYTLYADKMDTIIQPVEELGQAAGEQILRRVEESEAPVYEKVLTSAYKPYKPAGPGDRRRALRTWEQNEKAEAALAASASFSALTGTADGTVRRAHRQRRSARPPAA